MTINTICTWILVGIACFATPRRAEAAPAWCSTPNLKATIGESNSDVANVIDKKSSTALPAIVRATCFPDTEARQHAKEIDAARTAWTTKLGMTDEDWKDVAAWAAVDGMSLIIYDQQLDLGDPRQKLAISTLAPWQQFVGILNYVPNATQSALGSSSYSASLYLADALGPALSESGRLAFIQRCTEAQTAEIELVLCDAEIQRLDRKKLLAEIRADTTASGKMKTILRIKLMQLAKRLELYAAKVNEFKAKAPANEKMFAIAAATRKEWDSIWKSETELLQFTLAMDDARQTASRKALDGCSDKAWEMWTAQVGKVPASKFAGLDASHWTSTALSIITNTPQGYLAAVALFSCQFENRKKDPMIDAIGNAMQNKPGLRGPRLATQWAIANAGLVDDPKKLELPLAGQTWGVGSEMSGVFATVEKVGDLDASGTALVKFAKKTEKQETCLKSRTTNRINRILDDGSIIYYFECLKWGVAIIDKTPEPVKIEKRYLTKVKPGMNVHMIWESGVLGAVFPKGKRDPVAVLGVVVK